MKIPGILITAAALLFSATACYAKETAGEKPLDFEAIADSNNRTIAGSLAFLADLKARTGITIEAASVGGSPAYIITPKDIPESKRSHLIFNLHSGGYWCCAGEAGLVEAALIAALGGYKVVSVDYPLLPEHRYPAAVDVAWSAWKSIIASNDPRKVAVVSSSAGGAMTLALMLRAKAQGLPMPSSLVLGSPWADLTERDGEPADLWNGIAQTAKMYANGRELRDPQVSPVFGDLRGLPPTMLISGSRDVFLPMVTRLHQKLRADSVASDLALFEGLEHVGYLGSTAAPMTKDVFARITHFVSVHLGK